MLKYLQKTTRIFFSTGILIKFIWTAACVISCWYIYREQSYPTGRIFCSTGFPQWFSMIPKLKVSFQILLGSLRPLCEVYRLTPRSWHLTNKFSLRWMIWVKWHKMTSKCSEIESKSQIMLNSSLLGMFYNHVRSSTFFLLRVMTNALQGNSCSLNYSTTFKYYWRLQNKTALTLLRLHSKANTIKPYIS